ncbi:hypothetical protein, partial [Clavibacter michiganensis]|uniref:hypothetical protein n=1 Tax=Clavibacter michiganensis TaxID=28447 RepID=UPI00292D2744
MTTSSNASSRPRAASASGIRQAGELVTRTRRTRPLVPRRKEARPAGAEAGLDHELVDGGQPIEVVGVVDGRDHGVAGG